MTKSRRGHEWDFFIAHSSADSHAAEQLFDLLDARSRVFLDSKRLAPGDAWAERLALAQSKSAISVIIISARSDRAFYLGEEIARGISLAKQRRKAHRVVPLFLDKSSRHNGKDVPYGLQSLQHITKTRAGMKRVAADLLQLIGSAPTAPLLSEGTLIIAQLLRQIDELRTARLISAPMMIETKRTVMTRFISKSMR